LIAQAKMSLVRLGNSVFFLNTGSHQQRQSQVTREKAAVRDDEFRLFEGDR
jgi:hypothetical protein